MKTPNQEEGRASGMNALGALRSIQPPAAMQERVMQALAERARLRAVAPARGLRRYAWELWGGAAVGAAAIMLCLFALHTRRASQSTIEARLPAHAVRPAAVHADTATTTGTPRTAALSAAVLRTHEPRKEAAVDVSRTVIPHSPPPLPLTLQEHMLIALASTRSLAVSAAISQPIRDHGLGANALFELDHKRLTPLRPVALESTPLRPLACNSISSGENQ